MSILSGKVWSCSQGGVQNVMHPHMTEPFHNFSCMGPHEEHGIQQEAKLDALGNA